MYVVIETTHCQNTYFKIIIEILVHANH